jgi:Fanconi anemia group M protein
MIKKETDKISDGDERVADNKNCTIRIIADIREQCSKVIEALKNLGADVSVEQLVSADYLASDRVAIERKTVSDFLQSIIDKRIFNQAIALKENFKRPIIFIEGMEGKNIFESLYTIRSMSPNAIRGALSFLMLEHAIPVFFTDNYKETAQFIFTMARQEQIGGKEPWLRPKRSQDSIEEWQRYIVESLPGIGQKNAEALLEHFGSVENVMTASKEKIMKVDGFGEVRAEKIREILATQYKGLKNDAYEDR